MAASGQSCKGDGVDGEDLRDTVRAVYGRVAQEGATNTGASDCCGGLVGDPNAVPTELLSGDRDADAIARKLGYTEEQIALGKQSEGSNLGLGCGSPITFANLKAGETVIDLGSGGGFDAMVVAEKVGENGTVVGIDMTPDMIKRARKNAKGRLEKGQPNNVSFRLGEIEHLPCADNFADVIISNCVLNLSLDKAQVMREAFRVLKPGGRVAISDVVATSDIPERLRTKEAYAAWVTGAPRTGDLESSFKEAGFVEVSIEVKEESREVIAGWMPGSGAEEFVASAKIIAVKPELIENGMSKLKVDGMQEEPKLMVCGMPKPSEVKPKKKGW